MKRGALRRLCFIARRAVTPELRTEALRLALELLRCSTRLSEAPRATVEAADPSGPSVGESWSLPARAPTATPSKGYRAEPVDLGLYRWLAEALGEPLDTDWVASTEAAFRRDAEERRQEMEAGRAFVIEQTMRAALEELAHLHYDYGHLPESLKYLMREKEKCSRAEEIVNWTLDLMRIFLEQHLPGTAAAADDKGDGDRDDMGMDEADDGWATSRPERTASRIAPQVAEQFLRRAERNCEEKDVEAAAALRACLGLVALLQGEFRRAAKYFLAVTARLRESGATDMVALDDVAWYGVLASMVSFSRAEIKALVLDSPSFKEVLDEAPHAKHIVNAFYRLRFTECLASLYRARADLRLDLFLHRHVEAMLRAIRRKGFVQYVSPYATVDLRRMHRVFAAGGAGGGLSFEALEGELAGMIRAGDIHARLDGRRKALITNRIDARHEAMCAALSESQKACFMAETDALRTAMQRHRLMLAVTASTATVLATRAAAASPESSDASDHELHRLSAEEPLPAHRDLDDSAQPWQPHEGATSDTADPSDDDIRS